MQFVTVENELTAQPIYQGLIYPYGYSSQISRGLISLTHTKEG